MRFSRLPIPLVVSLASAVVAAIACGNPWGP